MKFFHPVFVKAVCGICVAAVAVLLCACQPTPEAPPIANRGQGLEEEFVIPPVAEGEKKETDAPAHLGDTWVLADGNVTIEADVDVTVPDISNTPVVELRQRELTDGRLQELVQYFVGDSRLYKIPHLTKAELEQILEDIQNGEGDFSDPGRPLTAFEVNARTLLETAPEAVEKEYIDVKFDTPTQTDGDYIYAKEQYLAKEEELKTQNSFDALAETGDPFASHIVATRYDDAVGSTSNFEYTRGIVEVERMEGHRGFYQAMLSYRGSKLENFFGDMSKYYKDAGAWLEGYDAIAQNPGVTEERARELADQVLADLGIADMALDAVKTGVQWLDDRHQQWMLNGLGYDLNNTKGGYQFTYVRQNAGLAAIGYSQATQENAPTFYPETISIFVTDEGVQQFKWSNMAQVVAVVAENTRLAPFDSVLKSYQDIVVYTAIPGGKTRRVLKRVELRSTNVVAFNAPGRTWMVPVWLFVEDYYGTLDEGKEVAGYEMVYLVNAIDGGFIEPTEGYLAGFANVE